MTGVILLKFGCYICVCNQFYPKSRLRIICFVLLMYMLRGIGRCQSDVHLLVVMPVIGSGLFCELIFLYVFVIRSGAFAMVYKFCLFLFCFV